MNHKTRSALWAILALAALSLFPWNARAQVWADVTTAGPTTFAGTVDGVAFTGTYVQFFDPLETNTTGTSTLFSGQPGTYTPLLPMSDSLGLFSEVGFSITFSKPVKDPVFDFWSLANTLDFGTPVTLLSAGPNNMFGGGGPIAASGTTVIGVPVGNGDDSNGTIQLFGTFTTITATAVGTIQSDGIAMIFAAKSAVPEPGSITLLCGILTVGGLTLRRRQKQADFLNAFLR